MLRTNTRLEMVIQRRPIRSRFQIGYYILVTVYIIYKLLLLSRVTINKNKIFGWDQYEVGNGYRKTSQSRIWDSSMKNVWLKRPHYQILFFFFYKSNGVCLPWVLIFVFSVCFFFSFFFSFMTILPEYSCQRFSKN